MGRRPASERVLAVARGDEPADVLLAGGQVLSPATREWVEVDLALADGVVAGWGRRAASEVVDVSGAYLAPGLIDAHMHLESTKLWVDQFVRAVLPRGTTAVVADPHEIANVLGVPGVAALIEAASGLPFTFGVAASSCVPASRFESAGATLASADVASLMDDFGALGVAEVMDFPGVVRGDPEVMAKIRAAGRRRVDGHAPGLVGPELDAYLAAGCESDHEGVTLAEAEERRRKGMWVFVREGSASRNLRALIPTVLSHGTDLVALCTDDREPNSILEDGHVNDCVRLAVEAGVDPISALVLATANPAAYHGLAELGSLGPGYQADVCVFPDLVRFEPCQVWQAGRLVAEGGEVVPGAVPARPAPALFYETVRLGSGVPPGVLAAAVPEGRALRVIGVEEGSLTTKALTVSPGQEGDVAHLAVVERHRSTGRVGVGFVSGFGIRRGAIASSVGHDAHNCMVLGARGPLAEREMAVALGRLGELGGGQVAVLDGVVAAEVPLPLAGLMSDRPAAEVARGLDRLEAVARADLGIGLSAPFMHLSFLGLSVIPELRLTDLGLVDVGRFELVPLEAETA